MGELDIIIRQNAQNICLFSWGEFCWSTLYTATLWEFLLDELIQEWQSGHISANWPKFKKIKATVLLLNHKSLRFNQNYLFDKTRLSNLSWLRFAHIHRLVQCRLLILITTNCSQFASPSSISNNPNCPPVYNYPPCPTEQPLSQ